MPVIPGPDQIQRTVIQPGNRVAQYQGGVAEDAAARAAQAEGQAAAGVFSTVGKLAGQVTDMADKELNRIEGLKVAEAVTKNRQKTLSLIASYKNTRGGDVTADGYLDAQMKAYEAQSSSSASTLTTTRQREAFTAAAESDRIGYSSGLMSHVFSETDKYTKLVRDASLATDRATAAFQYKDPKAVSASVASTAMTVSAILDHEGITDPDASAAVMLEHMGAVHTSVIVAALDKQDASFAKKYLAENKAAMTPEQVHAMAARVKPATEYAAAVELADTAKEMKASGKSASEVQDYLVRNAEDNDVRNLARSIVQAKEQALQVESDDRVGRFVTKFLDDGGTLAAAMEIRRSEAFKGELTAAEQGKLYEHLKQQGRMTDDRGRARADEKWQSLAVTEAFLDAINDPNLASKSKNQINNLLLTLGPTHTKQVMAEYMGQKSGVAKFNIDNEILNDGIPLDLREKRPVASLEAKRQERIAAFKGLVESGLQTFKETQKRTPSREEQAAIVLAARRDIVTPGSWFGRFGTTDETPIYALPKEQRDAISAADRKAAIASQASSMSESEFTARLTAQAKREGKSLSQVAIDAKWNKFNQGK